ncbi:MAG: hypothetical protein LC635_03795 [Pseudonocardiaceae bacterium]|nr:hypothetical protein [Pseudonocardiaceae bacterium]
MPGSASRSLFANVEYVTWLQEMSKKDTAAAVRRAIERSGWPTALRTG